MPRDRKLFDAEGFYEIPVSGNYPGLVAMATSDPDKDIVVLGDPVSGRALLKSKYRQPVVSQTALTGIVTNTKDESEGSA